MAEAHTGRRGHANHLDAALVTCSGSGAVSLAQATNPSGRTSSALGPRRSLASLATYLTWPPQRPSSAWSEASTPKSSSRPFPSRSRRASFRRRARSPGSSCPPADAHRRGRSGGKHPRPVRRSRSHRRACRSGRGGRLGVRAIVGQVASTRPGPASNRGPEPRPDAAPWCSCRANPRGHRLGWSRRASIRGSWRLQARGSSLVRRAGNECARRLPPATTVPAGCRPDPGVGTSSATNRCSPRGGRARASKP
jgi:hypothetical protein